MFNLKKIILVMAALSSFSAQANPDFTTGNSMELDVTRVSTDADGDRVNYKYEFLRNGAVVTEIDNVSPGSIYTLTQEEFASKKGVNSGVFNVRLVASDGKAETSTNVQSFNLIDDAGLQAWNTWAATYSRTGVPSDWSSDMVAVHRWRGGDMEFPDEAYPAERTRLYIGGWSNVNISHLDQFLPLTSAESFEVMDINNASGSMNIDGLKNIKTVTGNLSLRGVSSLTGLRSLESARDINLIGDYETLEGLSSLRLVSDELNFTSPSLKNVSGLGDDLDVDKMAFFNANSLVDISGLSALNGEMHSLRIRDADSLTSASGLENITRLTSELEIEGPLSSFEGLNNLEHAGVIRFTGTNSVNFTGLESLESVDRLYVESDTLKDFEGVKSGARFDVIFIEGSAFEGFKGLEQLTTIESIDVKNGILSDGFKALTNLSSVTNILTVDDSGLTSFEGLENLSSAGLITCENNSSLTSLNGLGNLSLSSSLYLKNNVSLVDISSLENVTVSGSVQLDSGIHLRAGFVGIPSSAWLCQPAQNGKFPGGDAQQAEVCV